jgi:uncharacterized protein (DUF2252 family)
MPALTQSLTKHLSVQDRIAIGERARSIAPPLGHAGWAPTKDRPDPVGLLEEQNVRRDADLVPVRHGRMMATPFTFYRGAAKIMAWDLDGTPTAGLQVQLCGDAHLSNFGVFASPERRLIFDLNDFDETLPGPFEYDVLRLAASLTVAARNNGFGKAAAAGVTMAAVTRYRLAMAEFAQMRTLDIWYAHLSEDEIKLSMRRAAKELPKGKAEVRQAKRIEARLLKNAQKAHSRDSLQALSKLGELVDGQYRIASLPPVLVPARELQARYGVTALALEAGIRDQYRGYRASLEPDRRQLLERFEFVDMARKVVGVGSVGTRAFIALLQGRDEGDPLFLQAKEATTSVLEGHLPRSRFRQPGERVVQGQRLMQASSDIFLGWTKGQEAGRYFYWRQLRDMKGSAEVELMIPQTMALYAGFCGWTLARAHARSGDPVAISAYLGADDDSFDLAVTDFSARYADQNERDFEAFTKAVAQERITAVEGV